MHQKDQNDFNDSGSLLQINYATCICVNSKNRYIIFLKNVTNFCYFQRDIVFFMSFQ